MGLVLKSFPSAAADTFETPKAFSLPTALQGSQPLLLHIFNHPSRDVLQCLLFCVLPIAREAGSGVKGPPWHSSCQDMLLCCS